MSEAPDKAAGAAPAPSSDGDARQESGQEASQEARKLSDEELSEVVGTEPAHLSPLETLRHSAAHVLAAAVKRVMPEAKVTIGPAIDTGFYYDFDVPRPFTPDDLKAFEKEMRKIISADEKFERRVVSRDEALKMFSDMGEQYKVEIIEGLAPDAEISVYQNGDFMDLCRGPHVDSTGEIKAVKLLTTAGAYWRGDERNPMLQRIYGTAFPSRDELKEHMRRLEEAKRRDHRKLGKDLDLFSIHHEKVGAGLVLWHPKGARIRSLIEDFWRKEHYAGGYELVYTPHVAREALWNTSGHTSFFKDNMFSGLEVEGQTYMVKPMNCPFHATIFRSDMRSYRELPFRWAELGTVYRYERSGVLHGLLRVRGFTQDDAHLFMREDQVDDELERVTRFCLGVLKAFGFEDFLVMLSTRPTKFIGEPEAWDRAEDAIRRALERCGLDYQVDPGGGAFYGPKIDIKLLDAIGRQWQCSTIQVDFQLPERFDLTYVGSDGAKHRVVMLHRALYGSLERFMAVLVEHYAGRFPMWLHPTQARVVAISERHAEFGAQVLQQLQDAGLRADADLGAEKLGKKIRNAQLEKIPYMLVIGDQEVEAKQVAPRHRDGNKLDAMSVEAFLAHVADEARMPSLADL